MRRILREILIRTLYFPVRLFILLEPLLKRIYYDCRNQILKQKLRSCGGDCYFRGSITVRYPERLSVGNNCHIGGNAYINAAGGVEIGDNTHISRNLTLYSYNHNYRGEALPYDDTIIEKPVVIGKNVWIGMDVKIVPGVTIGDGAIIGLGTVVSGDILPLAIVGNVPPRIIKYRDESHYRNLEESGCYHRVSGISFVKKVIVDLPNR